MTDGCPVCDALDDPRIKAFGMLVEAHAEATNAIQRDTADIVDFPLPWFSVLIRLARSPGAMLRMTALARDMTISTSGLTRLVDRMEAAGLVRRESCPGDRRGTNAVLTDTGRRQLSAIVEPHVDSIDHHLAAPLRPGELEQLTELLAKVRDWIRSSPSDDDPPASGAEQRVL